jgi:hypothetical protein
MGIDIETIFFPLNNTSSYKTPAVCVGFTAIARDVYLFHNMKSCYKNNTKNDYPMKHIVKMK